MPRSVAKLSLALALAVLRAPVQATQFFKFEPLSKEYVRAALAQDLLGNVRPERLLEIEQKMQPGFPALPKNEYGGLTHNVVRYVLHRFFVQQHGWYIRGLEPNGVAQDPNKPAGPLKDWLAAYVQDRFEERAGSKGIGLKDLAAIAATLEDLIKQEASKEMEEIYKNFGFSATERISSQIAYEAIQAYMMIYAVNRNVTIRSRQEFETKFERFSKRYKGLQAFESFIEDVEKRYSDLNSSEGVKFATVASVAAEMGERFGSFNDGECKELKQAMIGMAGSSGKVGRIRLHDFYNKSAYTHWRFHERVDYLRALGALDESTVPLPSVIISNYVSSFANCLKATTVYAVCCRNECEDLVSHLERQVRAPLAPAPLVAELVANLSSDTVAAPRQLPEALLARLSSLAERNGGKVQLHSRLFGQWMHHAFPLECPYPHEAGRTNPQTAAEWMERTGQSSQATDEEIQKIVEDACPADGSGGCGSEELELHWSEHEELLTPQASPEGGGRRLLWLLLVLLAGVAWLVGERMRLLPVKGRRLLRPFIFLCLCLSLCAADLLDLPLFILVASCAVVVHVTSSSTPCVESAMAKSDKYCV